MHSFLRMAKLAEPLMTSGGCLFAMSYYGADKAVAHYNVMGPVKAALEVSGALHGCGTRSAAYSGQCAFARAPWPRVPLQVSSTLTSYCSGQ